MTGSRQAPTQGGLSPQRGAQTLPSHKGAEVWLDEIRVSSGVAVRWPVLATGILLILAGSIFWRSSVIEWSAVPSVASAQHIGTSGWSRLAITLAVPARSLRCFETGVQVYIGHAGAVPRGPLTMRVDASATAPMDLTAWQPVGVASGAALSSIDLTGTIESTAARALFGEIVDTGTAKRLDVRIGVHRSIAELLWPGVAQRMLAQRCDLSL